VIRRKVVPTGPYWKGEEQIDSRGNLPKVDGGPYGKEKGVEKVGMVWGEGAMQRTGWVIGIYRVIGKPIFKSGLSKLTDVQWHYRSSAKKTVLY